MKVFRTFLAIGYTVTAMKEPMTGFRMCEENRTFSIGVRSFGTCNIRANFSDTWR